MIKAVLFDFDGTLADSSEGIFYTSTTVMKELGFAGPWEMQALRRFIGPPLPDSFRAAFALDESKIDRAVDRYREIYKEVGPNGCHLYDGIEELVCYLKGKGIKVAVATNKNQPVVEACMEALPVARAFDLISGTIKGVQENKAAVIKNCIDRFGLKPEEILMVGDTNNDREGAESNGVHFCAAIWGFGYSTPNDYNGLYYAEKPLQVIETIKKLNGGNMIEKIETKNAPAAIGPYSQAVKVGNFIFASGQIPVDPATGAIVEGTTADQAKQCFKNIKAVLAEAGSDITKVFKATVFLKDMNDFVAVNEVYADAFKDSPVLPARSAVQVAKLPKDVNVEIEVIALV